VQQRLSGIQQECNELADKSEKHSFFIAPVSAEQAIVDYAEKENIDLIVVGTKGKIGLKKMLFRSVASGVVITCAMCPVLVIK
jgi:nucleotide-binding universal stress UspA family protein